MRVFVSAYGSRGCIEPVVGLAVWLRALGAAVPVGQPVRPLVHGATSPPTVDLPRRAAELVAAPFDTGAAAAEGCDPLVMRGVMPVGAGL